MRWGYLAGCPARPVRARRSADASRTLPPLDEANAGRGLELLVPRAPQDVAGNADNHNIAQAWSILGSPGAPYKGLGALVAVLDGGIDRDINHNTAGDQAHPGFLNGLAQTRIIAHIQITPAPTPPPPRQHVDCNTLTDGSPPYMLPFPYLGVTSGYRILRHNPACGHGTAMAGIIAGNSWTTGTSGAPISYGGNGHAPEAEIIDLAATSVPPGAPASDPWELTDEDYLSAIEALRGYILQSQRKVAVLNISFFGEPSPDAPISLALDGLAREEDILIVTAAGNFGDSTAGSNGYYHGLAVGAVHSRVSGQNLSFVPLPQSSRGPLVENTPGRFYPDLCATGGGPGHLTSTGSPEFDYPFNSWSLDGSMNLVGIDINTWQSALGTGNRVSPNRPGLGSSEACAQIAGAAALYRGFLPTATALETKAALLLNVIGTYGNVAGTSSEPADQHTYTGRNTFGVGYLRDDHLAEFAKNLTAVEPLRTNVTLTQSVPSVVTANYGNLTPGAKYVVVCCWYRQYDPINDTQPPGRIRKSCG